ncbi:hypothetical protein AK830_g2766 [Neonectria ditissima]|uniref:DUF2306 domain-containing protein n=1 Tax=Neonectria ditissima TaxID=78410 RepID=A0A0P7BJB1_9HYPO|nr:hypothetical protein AK830_g2766 [Neonectria ditissima]
MSLVIGKTTQAKSVQQKQNTASPALPSDKRGSVGNTDATRGPGGLWWLMALPSFLISVYAIFFFTGNSPGDPKIVKRILSTTSGIVHISGSLITLGVGPIQYLHGLRRDHPVIHRWVGRVYTVGNTIGGVAAFYVTFHSLANTWGKVGFAALALCWLWTMGQGMRAIWANDAAGHRDWMTRNFSLSYAAVMLRWQLPMFILMGVDTFLALSITGYLSWIPNLIFAEYCIRRTARKSRTE